MAARLLTNDTAAAARSNVRAGKYLASQLANEEFGIRVLTVREIMACRRSPPSADAQSYQRRHQSAR